jgi:signal transduction histidine kinase/ActR/RegA family two-component response regulator
MRRLPRLLRAGVPRWGRHGGSVREHSLRTQLALALVLAAAVPLVVAVLLSTISAAAEATEAARSEQTTLADALAAYVADYVGLHEAAIRSLAEQPGLLALDPTAQQERVYALQSTIPDLANLSLNDAAGVQLAASGYGSLPSVANLPVFQEVRQTHQPSVRRTISPIREGPVIVLGAPIETADGQFAGLVVGVLLPEQLDALVARASMGAGVEVYVVDAQDRPVAHTQGQRAAGLADLSASPPVLALRADADGSGTLRYATAGDAQLVSYARVADQNWGVFVERPEAAVLAGVRERGLLTLVVLLLAVGLAIGAGVAVAGRLARPLAALARAADTLAIGDLAVAIPRSGAREVAQLADAFRALRNSLAVRTTEVEHELAERRQAEARLHETAGQLEKALADLLRAQSQLVQQERLRALGEMASGIAHDFNNALAPILGYSELLLHRPEQWGDQARVAEYLTLIKTGAQDAANIVRRLREFARSREADEALQTVQLNTLIGEMVALTRPRWKDQALAQGRQIMIETDLGPVPGIAGNGADLREALTNLLFNAVDALPQGGTITLRTRADGDQVLLEVSDTGTGMPEEVRQRCLEPFFTTKGEHGTGLGLAMVYGIIQRHDGTLEIESAPGQGTTICLRFPARSEPLVPATRQSAVGPTRALHVLVVDDEERLRAVAVAYLTGDGHTVETAVDGVAGLARFLAGAFDLVITDQAMPGMTGDQLALAIKAASPTTPVIMMTGLGDLMEATGERPSGVDTVVSKPATLEELRRALAEVSQAERPEAPAAAPTT